MRTFTLWGSFRELMSNAGTHKMKTPQWLFSIAVVLLATFFAWKVIRYPFEKYYHWDDPLLTRISGTPQNLNERLKYKKKETGWQET